MKRHAIEEFGVRSAESGEIRVERLHERLDPRIPFPHTHDFYQLLLVTQGTGWHEIDFHRTPVKRAAVFVMKPGQVHSWRLSKKAKGFVIEFTDVSVLSFLDQLRAVSDAYHIQSHQDFAAIVKVAEVMEEEFRHPRAGTQDALQGLLSGLLVKLLRESGHRKTPGAGDIASDFRESLERDFRVEHGVSHYARVLKTSPKALTMRLKRVLDRSPRELIQDRLTLEAKRLLSHSKLSISEVGYSLGFDDPNYFARFFKKQTRVTPAEFRRKKS